MALTIRKSRKSAAMKRLDLLRAIHGKPQSVRERLGLKTRRKRKSRGARLLKLLTN